MGHLAKPRDASFFRVFFNPYHYGVLTRYDVWNTCCYGVLTYFGILKIRLCKNRLLAY